MSKVSIGMHRQPLRWLWTCCAAALHLRWMFGAAACGVEGGGLDCRTSCLDSCPQGLGHVPGAPRHSLSCQPCRSIRASERRHNRHGHVIGFGWTGVWSGGTAATRHRGCHTCIAWKKRHGLSEEGQLRAYSPKSRPPGVHQLAGGREVEHTQPPLMCVCAAPQNCSLRCLAS
jgi:hypothetical protein